MELEYAGMRLPGRRPGAGETAGDVGVRLHAPVRRVHLAGTAAARDALRR